MARGIVKSVVKDNSPKQDAGKTESDGKPTPVNLGDQAGLKRGLDDCAVSSILDAGYDEEFFVSNVKIILGGITIAIALLAQFYPKKYPDNWVILLVCLILYSLGTAALSLFTSLIEEDSFLITKPKKDAGELVLRVSSRLPRYSDEYKLMLDSSRNRKVTVSSLWRQCPREGTATLVCSLTEFYDDKGFLHEEKFAAEVRKLLSNFEKSYKKVQ
ncbi:probable signal peptidase complex subunit 2 [Coccomyxa sp. Obi]|nr:probable signal peptidase complex subunit 2 [Coccomyxa sp. Obi]